MAGEIPKNYYPHVSPAPWMYFRHEWGPGLAKDWIEDANGDVVVANVGWIVGPRIVEAVNYVVADQRDKSE